MFEKIPWGSLKVWLTFACGTLNLKTFSTGGIPHAGCRQMPAFPTHLKRKWSQFESWKKLQGSCHHSKRPIYVPIHSRYTWFPCTDSTVSPSIDAKHDGMCDNAVAPRKKATDPYVNSTGSLMLLLQLKRKVGLHVSTPWRGLTPLLKLHRNTENTVSTGEESWGSGLSFRWGRRAWHRLERSS